MKWEYMYMYYALPISEYIDNDGTASQLIYIII